MLSSGHLGAEACVLAGWAGGSEGHGAGLPTGKLRSLCIHLFHLACTLLGQGSRVCCLCPSSRLTLGKTRPHGGPLELAGALRVGRVRGGGAVSAVGPKCRRLDSVTSADGALTCPMVSWANLTAWRP